LSDVVGYSIVSEARPLRSRLVAVALDTSLQLAEVFKPGSGGFDWNAVLDKLPDGARVALFAGSLSIPAMNKEGAKKQWPELLRNLNFDGADEQTGTIEHAWDLAAGEENAAVLWIHGKLPVQISDASGVVQRLKRRSPGSGNGSPRLFSLQLTPGANRLEEDFIVVSRLPSFYGIAPQERLEEVFANVLYPGMKPLDLYFSRSRPLGATILPGSPHIARLAYADWITGETAIGDLGRVTEGDMNTAIKLRLVTPVTGAVVLENSEQYTVHGLDPAAMQNNVPTIPEPEEILLFLVVCLLLFVLYRRQMSMCSREG
jgi:hypothetical protein